MSNIQDTDLFVIQRPGGATAGTYKVQAQELNEYVGENAPPPIEYKGARDFTKVEDDPLTGTDTFTPAAGNLLINEATAPGNWVWTSIDPSLTQPVEVQPGDRCIWNDAGYWELVPGGGGGGQVIELDGTYPITIDDSVNGSTTEPIIEIEAAKRTDGSAPVDKSDLAGNGGAVEALATAADVVAGAGASPNPNSVVTADLLKAANDEIAAITDPTTGYVSSVDKGTTGSGNAALTINPTTGDVKIDLAGIDTNTPDTPGVITPNEIIAIIEGEVTGGNLVSSVEVGPNDGGATTISPTAGDVKVEVAAATQSTPGVISIGEIEGIIQSEGTAGNVVISVEEGDLAAAGVFSHTALKIDPSAGEVKINVKDEVFVPYDFDTHLQVLPAATSNP